MQFSLRLGAIFLAVFLLPFHRTPASAQTAVQNGVSADSQNTRAGDLRDIPAPPEVIIPGPLRSFERMAGISQKVASAKVLQLLARNVYVQGYVGWQDNGTPTEFLILLDRYVNQAKELAALAGPGEVIHIYGCAGGRSAAAGSWLSLMLAVRPERGIAYDRGSRRKKRCVAMIQSR